jgi:transposase
MIDFPITELLDDGTSLIWLERHLHPEGLHCPRCQSTARRVFRAQVHFPAYRCRACGGYSTLLTGTVFAKTQQRPATLVLPLRGVAKGEPTAPLARELGLSRKQLQTLRQRIQAHLNATAPTGVMPAPPLRLMSSTRTRGKKSTPHRDRTDPPRRRANKHKGHGTYANDRPPIISLISRDTGEQRWWVYDHANRQTCQTLIADNVLPGSTLLYTDEWQSYRGSHPRHATVAHGVREWARDDHGDGRREVHCNSCVGAGTALRTYLCACRGVHTQDLHLYLATYEAMISAKRVTPALIRRMGLGDRSAQLATHESRLLSVAYPVKLPTCLPSTYTSTRPEVMVIRVLGAQYPHQLLRHRGGRDPSTH